jgi:predicted DNA-binding ribbon-helix-helix protein
MMNEGSSTPVKTIIDSNKIREYSSGALQSKNVRIHTRRTSVRLEPAMWNALNEIAAREGCSIHDLCGAVHDLKEPAASFTAALRVFMMEYYRSAALVNGQVSQVQKKIKANQMMGLQT